MKKLSDNAFDYKVEQLKALDNQCVKTASEYEVCKTLHTQLDSIFAMRQQKYFKDLSSNKVNTNDE
jgi:hypothetical protein